MYPYNLPLAVACGDVWAYPGDGCCPGDVGGGALSADAPPCDVGAVTAADPCVVVETCGEEEETCGDDVAKALDRGAARAVDHDVVTPGGGGGVAGHGVATPPGVEMGGDAPLTSHPSNKVNRMQIQLNYNTTTKSDTAKYPQCVKNDKVNLKSNCSTLIKFRNQPNIMITESHSAKSDEPIYKQFTEYYWFPEIY